MESRDAIVESRDGFVPCNNEAYSNRSGRAHVDGGLELSSAMRSKDGA